MIGEAVAAAVAAAALNGAIALENNAYKINVIKTLVKRALLNEQ